MDGHLAVGRLPRRLDNLGRNRSDSLGVKTGAYVSKGRLERPFDT